MTCHVCANPTCVDDCQNYPPPALKVGSAEQKLQELLKIADELALPPEYCGDQGDIVCYYCNGHHTIGAGTKHDDGCPILKLEQFKKTL